MLVAALAACAAPGVPAPSEPARFAATVAPPPVVPASKVIVLVIENKGFSQMMSSTNAPFISGMAKKFGYASNMYAMTHPSQPNYVWMVAGANRGITSNSYSQITGPSILGNTIKAGRTAKVIAHGMGDDRCRQSNYGKYAYRHNPWVSFKDERKLCESQNFDYKYFAGDVTASKLANVEFLIPDNCKNAHDCSIRTADDWFKLNVNRLMAGPDYQAGKLAIIITADEDNKREDNRILTVVIHPSQTNKVVTKRLDLVSLHMTLARFGHTPPLGTRWKTTTDLATAFNLPVE